jgi:DNA topoisomerase-1
MFRGKSGVQHKIELSEPRLAAIVRRMQDLPGEELFQYRDESAAIRAVESNDVNAYIREASGDDFTSKDFRTWAGTVLAAKALLEIGPFGSQSEARHNIVRAVESVSKQLGNTRAVCRKCYIHPLIMDSYLESKLAEFLQNRSLETGVIALLERRLKRKAASAGKRGALGRIPSARSLLEPPMQSFLTS